MSWRWFLVRLAGLSGQAQFRQLARGEPVRLTAEQQLSEALARGRR